MDYIAEWERTVKEREKGHEQWLDHDRYHERRWCKNCNDVVTPSYRGRAIDPWQGRYGECPECDTNFYDKSYGCPICGWRWIGDDIDERFNKEGELDQEGEYPKYGEVHVNDDGYHSWDETHYCPFCKKEFGFINGA